VSAPTADAPARAQGSTLDELRALARLAAPIAIAQLGLVTMSLVDTAALGRVSVVDLAGAGIGRSIGFGTTIVGIGVTGGLEPLAAQAIGSGDPARAWMSYRSNRQAALLVWPVAMLAAFAITLALPGLGVEDAVVSRARLYLAGQAPGYALLLAYFSARTFLLAHGCTRPALIGAAVANLVNLPLVNVLARGDAGLRSMGLPGMGIPALGALGGGLAFSAGCLVLYAFVLRATVEYRPTARAPEVALSTIYRLGLPVGFQMLAEVGVFSLVALLTGRLGAPVTSAHHIAIGMASFTFMGAVGVSDATAVVVGHAIGAGRSPRRSGALGIVLGAFIMTFGALAFATAPRLIALAFTDDEGVIAITVDLLRIAALFQVFDGVQAVAAGALRGAGDMRFPFLANVAAHWLVGFPAAMLLGFVLHRGAVGLWWGLTAGLVFVSALLASRFAYITRHAIAPVT
jgi:MATE family multidrug resistance protein